MAHDRLKRNKPGEYNSSGSFLSARKKLGSKLASNPAAFTLFEHYVGWANFEDNDQFKRGELPTGDKDMARRLGWGSVLTVKKAKEWLEAHQYIKTRKIRTGPKRGTIIRIVNYDKYQDFKTYLKQLSPRSQSDPRYALSGSQSDPRYALSGSQNDLGHTSPGSQNDPSKLRSTNYDLLLLQDPVLSAYFAKLPPKKVKKEKESFEELLKTFELEQIARATEYLSTHKVPSKGELRMCDYPLSYLCHYMDKVLTKIQVKQNNSVEPTSDSRKPEAEKSLEELEKELEALEKQSPGLTGPLRRALEQRRASLP